MRFSIVTPSFRNSQWLRLCIASVADQEGVEFEHIIQDSCSDDGTQDWLPKDSRVCAVIEEDKGMYDAVNRGFRRATGQVLAYLNCDEQFLPGALARVSGFFEAHPETDVVLTDTIVTDSAGSYICNRCSLTPRRTQMWVRFPVLTCALFVRRRVVHELGIWLDTQWRDMGDWFWVMAMVRGGAQFQVLPELTSVFTDTGENMNLKPNALRERRRKWEMAPPWVKLCKYPMILLYRLRLAARGAHRLKPYDYSLYTQSSPNRRITHHVPRPTSFWKRL